MELGWFLAAEFSVESLYINGFAGERHDCFLKYPKGGGGLQGKFKINPFSNPSFLKKFMSLPSKTIYI